jgi:hypothetical protein
VQAENVAGDHKGQNLPFAVGQEPVAECHPMREHEGRAGHVTLDHEVGIRLEAFLIEAQRSEHADVLGGERYEMRELCYERAASPRDVCDHAAPLSPYVMDRVPSRAGRA